MGRYSSVQAYADNNANVRSISYDQATGGTAGGGGNKTVVTEKVSNPYGSTAGAGSGEFHVYRHARAREAARWKALDESEQQAELEQQFQQEWQLAQSEEAQKTERRRKKRQREKEAKQRKKNLKAAGIMTGESGGQSAVTSADDAKEFTYVPVKEQEVNDSAKNEDAHKSSNEPNKGASEQSDATTATSNSPVEEVPNDGSFLELMKRKLQAGQEARKMRDGDDDDDDDDDYDEGPMNPPPAKKLAMETRIIDEDDEEGPMPQW